MRIAGQYLYHQASIAQAIAWAPPHCKSHHPVAPRPRLASRPPQTVLRRHGLARSPLRMPRWEYQPTDLSPSQLAISPFTLTSSRLVSRTAGALALTYTIAVTKETLGPHHKPFRFPLPISVLASHC